MKNSKINIFILGIIFVSLTLITTSCKKDKDTAATKSKPSDQQGSNEADGAIDDVNDFVNNKIGGGSNHKSSAYNLPCGVVYMDSSTTNGSGNKIYKMHYGNQTPCGYKKKSGIVTFDIVSGGTAFNTAGMTFRITFKDYIVESLATGETVEIDGSVTVKNINGGYIWETVTMASTIVYQFRGTFSVTYADGTVRDRSYFQLRTYTAPSANWASLSVSVDGDTLVGSKNICEIGRTYDGDYSYKTEMITAFTWSNCGSTYAGPYLLKSAHARMNITVPAVSPTYVDVEGGYYWDYTNAIATPTLVNDCTTNAYKITSVIGTTTATQYQLY
jgi:hypothetical protein